MARDRIWTIRDVLGWTTERFTEQGLGSPRLDAEVLLAHRLGCDRLRLYLDHDKPLSADELAGYRATIRRRLAGEPVAYITGCKEFWSLELEVDRRVLVPRPETELLVEIGLRHLEGVEQGDRATVVDVGTGCGAVVVAIGHERPGLNLLATDASADALEVARRNAGRHGVEVAFHQGELLAPLPADLRLDLVLANLPYIPKAEMATLPRDVARWEPPDALDGGPDGLDLIRRLVPQAAGRMAPGACLALEIAADQSEAVLRLIEAAGLVETRVHRDLAGLDRVVVAQARR